MTKASWVYAHRSMRETGFSGSGFIENSPRNLQGQKGEVFEHDPRKDICRLQGLEHTGEFVSSTRFDELHLVKQLELHRPLTGIGSGKLPRTRDQDGIEAVDAAEETDNFDPLLQGLGLHCRPGSRGIQH